ncbi:MAG: ClpXP protease specificity-enhancing factor [Idiomarina sp.]|nr:ClpXP protease specificity-enhancing factor [Idiomarina sp.]
MTPKRPYILRALYEWLIDNELTPHIVVDAEWPYIQVPQQYVQDGQIVLNIAPGALQGLQMGNEEIRFFARFQGKEQRVLIPMGALLAIYAKENGAGTIFEPEEAYLLEIQDEQQGESGIALATTDSSDNANADQDDSNDSTSKTSKKKKSPSLRIVK